MTTTSRSLHRLPASLELLSRVPALVALARIKEPCCHAPRAPCLSRCSPVPAPPLRTPCATCVRVVRRALRVLRALPRGGVFPHNPGHRGFLAACGRCSLLRRATAMPVRNVGKWGVVALIAWTSGNAVASCGGTGTGSVFIDGGQGDGSSSGASSDATTGGDGRSFGGADGGRRRGGLRPEDVHRASATTAARPSAAGRSSTAAVTPPTRAVRRARSAAPGEPTCAGPAAPKAARATAARPARRRRVSRRATPAGTRWTAAATLSTATPTTPTRAASRRVLRRGRLQRVRDGHKRGRRRHDVHADDVREARLPLRRGLRRLRPHPPVRDVHRAPVLRRRRLRPAVRPPSPSVTRAPRA